MNLHPLVKANRLRPHATSLEELEAIRALIQRDLHDANIEALSRDRRFATAYDGALQLCRLVLACAGYRVPFVVNYHDASFEAAELVLGKAAADLRAYFGACRRKRNVVDYDAAEVVSESETAELVRKAHEFRDIAEVWIAKKHEVFKLQDTRTYQPALLQRAEGASCGWQKNELLKASPIDDLPQTRPVALGH